MDTQQQVEELADTLCHGEPQQQHAAARQLVRLGEAARPAAVALCVASGTRDEALREWAVAALEDLGPPCAGQYRDLSRLAAHPNGDVAYWAITLLGRAAAQAADAVPALEQALRQRGDVAVRERAAWALGKIGRRAATALESLHWAAVQPGHPRLQRLARRAIEQITEPGP